MHFEAPTVCQWAHFVSSAEKGAATNQFLEDCRNGEQLCKCVFGAESNWFSTPTLSTLRLENISAATTIETGWFKLPRVSKDMIFHYKDGRLDAFFTSKDAAAKFNSMRSEGRHSQVFSGFCITKDLAKTSCFPSSNATYWREALKLISDLEELCLVIANKKVATLCEEQSYSPYGLRGDYLGYFWDLPSDPTILELRCLCHCWRKSVTF